MSLLVSLHGYGSAVSTRAVTLSSTRSHADKVPAAFWVQKVPFWFAKERCVLCEAALPGGSVAVGWPGAVPIPVGADRASEAGAFLGLQGKAQRCRGADVPPRP